MFLSRIALSYFPRHGILKLKTLINLQLFVDTSLDQDSTSQDHFCIGGIIAKLVGGIKVNLSAQLTTSAMKYTQFFSISNESNGTLVSETHIFDRCCLFLLLSLEKFDQSCCLLKKHMVCLNFLKFFIFNFASYICWH